MQGKQIINKTNYCKCYYEYIIENNYNNKININDETFKLIIEKPKTNHKYFSLYNDIQNFFDYQYRYISFILFHLSQKDNIQFENRIEENFNILSDKFKYIFQIGNRSFLTKVAEKDASINCNMYLKLLSIKKSVEEEYQLE